MTHSEPSKTSFLPKHNHFETLFDTDDLDSCRDAVGRIFKPHRLDLLGRKKSIAARMSFATLGALSISRLQYGADVSISPGPLESFYLLQIPLKGNAQIHAGGQSFTSTTRYASMLSPEPDLQMRWSGDVEQVIIKMDASHMRRVASDWLGIQVDSLRFDPCLDLNRQQAVVRVVQQLAMLWSRFGRDADHPAVIAPIESAFVSALLLGQNNNLNVPAEREARALPSATVNDTAAYLAAYPEHEHSPASLAARAGVGSRALQAAFARYRSASPMAFLRSIRLERVRDDLRNGQSHTRVTDVALRWGFTHLGRFSVAYRRRFGETPSQTLRKAGAD